MKIVYCLQALHRRGGIERVLTTKANYLAALGHEVHIVTTDQRDGTIAFELDPRIQLHDLGLNYELDNDLGRFGRLKALLQKRPLHRERLSRLLRELKPDITVSTFFQEASLLPSLSDGSKKVLEMHSSRLTPVLMYPKERYIFRLLGRLRIWANERLARKYDRVVILTHEELPLWHKLSNVCVIPNALPFTAENLSADMSSKRVIAVGRFEYQKNFKELIDIWALLPEEIRHEWHLDIYGDGYHRWAYMDQIEALSLSNSVSIHKPSGEIKQRYLEHSIYCMTSHYEGLPMVLLEAQTLGLPVVTYACPSGAKDIVSDGVDGFLVAAGDKRAFVERLLSLMQDEDLRRRMGVQAQVASKRFALDKVMAQWLSLFEELGK